MKMTHKFFSSSGSWTCPAGVKIVLIHACGGGGGGGGGSSGSTITTGGTGAGGGGGGAATWTFMYSQVTPGNSYTVTIGGGGAGGPVGTDGTNGGDTVFGLPTLTFFGGQGGKSAISTYPGSPGGPTRLAVGTGFSRTEYLPPGAGGFGDGAENTDGSVSPVGTTNGGATLMRDATITSTVGTHGAKVGTYNGGGGGGPGGWSNTAGTRSTASGGNGGAGVSSGTGVAGTTPATPTANSGDGGGGGGGGGNGPTAGGAGAAGAAGASGILFLTYFEG